MFDSKLKYKRPSQPFIASYLIGLKYSTVSLIFGHPAERLKAASQMHLEISSLANLKSIVKAPHMFKNLYIGLPACFYRQNIKVFYRTPLLTAMPAHIDRLNMNAWFGIQLKAMFACSIDTIFVTPAENVKTVQMQKSTLQHSIFQVAKDIYITRGLAGFFAGFSPTLLKSFPSWFYLFLSYQTTRNHRQPNSLLSTISCATVAAVPITLLTNPIDVIKTQMQMLKPETPSLMIQTGKKIFETYGLFAFGRGMPFRLIHKAATTATGFAMLASVENKHQKTR